MIGVCIEQIVCSDSDIKNQGYSMISASGDVVVSSAIVIEEDELDFPGYPCLALEKKEATLDRKQV
jgi:hypothetical protein